MPLNNCRVFPAKQARQAGQAIVETIVIFGVVVLVFLSILYLGKFHDVQASTIQAARYASWERTALGPGFTDTELAQQTRSRLFQWNDDAFKASDGVANGTDWGHQNANWKDHGDSQRLVDKAADVSVSTKYFDALPGSAPAKLKEIANEIGTQISKLVCPCAWPIDKGGMYTSEVTVKLNDIRALPAPLNELGLNLKEKTSLVTDSWDASSPAQAAERTKAFTTSERITNLTKTLSPSVKEAMTTLEPNFAKLHPGQVCTDVMPADRVSEGSLPAYGGAECY
jgi:hypothetical protein